MVDPNQDGVSKSAVDPRSFLQHLKVQTNQRKVLDPEEVISCVETLVISELHKKREGNSLLLSKAEVEWVRDLTKKLAEKAKAETQFQLPEGGYDETPLRKMVQMDASQEIESLTVSVEDVPQEYTVYAAQECGKRDAQEDTYVCLNSMKDLFAWSEAGFGPEAKVLQNNYICCAVYDGHGGRLASEFCRTQFHMHVLRALHEGMSLPDSLPVAIDKCNARFNTKADKMNSDAGTTASIVFIEQGLDGDANLVTANLGDCRVVLCSAGLPIELTRDHKPYDDHEKKVIEAKGGEVVFNCGAWRVNGVLTVSRALGSVRSCQKYLSTIPDVSVRKLIPEDEFVLIASDGLWNVMSSEEAVNFVLEAKASIDDEREDPQDEEGCELSYQLIADGLVDHAIEELSSDDNVTVIIIFLQPQP
uniref:PPM-type phosphatase domain-containing protein n=1 Tax=Eutreptiella gymnastica TaxID=73025 RepID=A0A7S1I2P6_9EUGL|mmetsp:Transcript_124247/g.215379  ORF Transcript_124247/g.215379 Transcript_124247/m.215379 type:complete len:418 (+) Transcript_124247:79-1332(+)